MAQSEVYRVFACLIAKVALFGRKLPLMRNHLVLYTRTQITRELLFRRIEILLIKKKSSLRQKQKDNFSINLHNDLNVF